MNENFIEIPVDQLSNEAVEGVIKNHLLKQLGSETVSSSFSMEKKISHIKSEISRGSTLLIYDKKNEEVMLARKSDYLEFRKSQKKSAPVWHGAMPPDESLPF